MCVCVIGRVAQGALYMYSAFKPHSDIVSQRNVTLYALEFHGWIMLLLSLQPVGIGS
jgi:hypothetical protein